MIRFGPGGNSQKFYEEGKKSSLDMPEWLKKRGLSAYEYQCNKGVKIGEKTARQIGEKGKAHDILISIHAPYYINMASDEERIKDNSIMHIVKCLEIANFMDAKRIVFHPGSVGKKIREEAFRKTKELFARTIQEADERGLFNQCYLCPELMGKINQIGDLDEVMELCKMDERVLPAIDFGHLNARTLGGLKDVEDFDHVFQVIENSIGEERTQKIHVHFSRIEFSKGGEKKHWNFSNVEYGPEFSHLAKVLAKRQIEPVIICESMDNMVEDALEMKRMFKEAQNSI
jgi:deoxyribonuclease IV